MAPSLGQFNYQLAGPEGGRPWIFLHGLMGSGQNWRRIVKEIQARSGDSQRLLTFDQRGHGKSFHAEGYLLEDFAADVKMFVDQMGWAKVILVGHSLGARVALEFSNSYPQHVLGLVMSDMDPGPKKGIRTYYETMLGLVPTPFATRESAQEFFLLHFPAAFRAALGEFENLTTLGSFLHSNLQEQANGQLDWRFDREGVLSSVEQGRGTDQWAQWESLQVPALVVRGEKSETLSPADFVRMGRGHSALQASGAAHSQDRLEIANAGHWVHADAPVEFSDAIWAFAQRIARAPIS